MLKENSDMQKFLSGHGIECRVKRIHKGSLKGTWRLYNPDVAWTGTLGTQLMDLGFTDYNGMPFNVYSGNGGRFSVFVRGHDELADLSKSLY